MATSFQKEITVIDTLLVQFMKKKNHILSKKKNGMSAVRKRNCSNLDFPF